MNTGQFLASLSGLSSGSALAHLQTVSAGGGPSGETIYATHFNVLTTIDKLVVTQKPKREAAQVIVDQSPQQNSTSKYAFVHTTTPQQTVRTGTDELWITMNRETF